MQYLEKPRHSRGFSFDWFSHRPMMSPIPFILVRQPGGGDDGFELLGRQLISTLTAGQTNDCFVISGHLTKTVSQTTTASL